MLLMEPLNAHSQLHLLFFLHKLCFSAIKLHIPLSFIFYYFYTSCASVLLIFKVLSIYTTQLPNTLPIQQNNYPWYTLSVVWSSYIYFKDETESLLFTHFQYYIVLLSLLMLSYCFQIFVYFGILLKFQLYLIMLLYTDVHCCILLKKKSLSKAFFILLLCVQFLTFPFIHFFQNFFLPILPYVLHIICMYIINFNILIIAILSSLSVIIILPYSSLVFMIAIFLQSVLVYLLS